MLTLDAYAAWTDGYAVCLQTLKHTSLGYKNIMWKNSQEKGEDMKMTANSESFVVINLL